MEQLPSQYMEYADVFAKGEADILPSHCSYDHSIQVEEGTTPPFGPIYSMPETELTVLREYLDEMLGKELIRSSNSPAGAPILFVKKKDGWVTLTLCGLQGL